MSLVTALKEFVTHQQYSYGFKLSWMSWKDQASIH